MILDHDATQGTMGELLFHSVPNGVLDFKHIKSYKATRF